MGGVSALDGVLVAVAVLVTAWWAVATQRWPAALECLSVGAVAVATVTLAIEGLRWQVVPWQGLALAVGLAAGLRRWRSPEKAAGSALIVTALQPRVPWRLRSRRRP